MRNCLLTPFLFGRIRPEELKAMAEDERERVLKERQAIMRALCDKALVFAEGRVRGDCQEG